MRLAIPLSLLSVASPLAQKPLATELGTTEAFHAECSSTLRVAGTLTAAPTEVLPRLAKNGAAPTAKLAYATWHSDTGLDTLHFGRTTDGGVKWSRRALYRATGSSEIIDNFQIGAEGHTVFVCWRSNRTGHRAPWNLWIMGSADQGLTWSAPVLANPTTAAAGDGNNFAEFMQMSVTRDSTSKAVRAHVVFEFGDRRNPSPRGFRAEERPYYTALEIAAGTPRTVVAERDVSTVPARQNPDVDKVSVYAKGGTVMVCWRNDRNQPLNLSSHNQQFGNHSTDGGRTWGNDYLLGTGLDPKINSLNGRSANDCGGFNMAADGNNLYYLWKDRSHGNATAPAVDKNEQLVLAASRDLGKTWSQQVITTYRAGLADVDQRAIVAAAGRVIIAVTSDERGRHKSISGMRGTLTNTPADLTLPADNQGDGDPVDGVQVFVSQDAGRTFASQWLSRPSVTDGSVTATQGLTNGPGAFKVKGTNCIACSKVQLAMRGDAVHVAWEEHWYSATGVEQGEDLLLRQSYDGGGTWSPARNVTAVGGEARGFQTALGRNGDIDTPFLAMTGNGQAVVGYRLQDPHGSLVRPQRPFAAVRGHIELETFTSGAGRLELRNVPATEAGNLALVLGTFNPAATPLVAPQLFGNLGFEPNIVPDAITNAFSQLLVIFSAPVRAGGGTVRLPLAPDLRRLIPVPIYVVGLTFDARSSEFRSFTARNRY